MEWYSEKDFEVRSLKKDLKGKEERKGKYERKTNTREEFEEKLGKNLAKEELEEEKLDKDFK